MRNRTFFFGTFEGVRRAQRSHAVAHRAARRVPQRRPVERRHCDPEPVHRPAVCRTTRFRCIPSSAKILDDDVRASEPVAPAPPSTGRTTSSTLRATTHRTASTCAAIRHVSDRQRFFVRLTYKDIDKDELRHQHQARQVHAGDRCAPARRLAQPDSERQPLERIPRRLCLQPRVDRLPAGRSGAQLDHATSASPACRRRRRRAACRTSSSPTAASSAPAATNRPTSSASRSSSATTSPGRRAAHTFKGGVDVQRVEYRISRRSSPVTTTARTPSPGNFTGNAFADFLVGLPATTRYAQNPPDAQPYTTQFAGYIQDDWRAVVEADGQLRRALRPAAALPGSRQPARELRSRLSWRPHHRRQRGGQGADPAVGEERGAEYADRHRGRSRAVRAPAQDGQEQHQSSDRFRLPASDDGRTVIRGGYGIYTVPLYGSISYSMYASATGDVPSFQNAALPSGGFAIQFPNVFPAGAARHSRRRHAGFPPRQSDRSARSADATVDGDRRAGSWLEHRVSASATWARRRRTWSSARISTRYDRIRPAMRRFATSVRSSDWNVVTTRDNGSRARYDGLSFEFSKRFAQGLSFTSSYTLARHDSDSARRGAHRVHCGERALDARSLPRRCRLRPCGFHPASSIDQHLLLCVAVHRARAAAWTR